MIHTLQRNDEISTNLFDSVAPTQKNALIHGDCIDVMRQMPAATVDLVVTDPPYS
jgi:predicted methyltransferase